MKASVERASKKGEKVMKGKVKTKPEKEVKKGKKVEEKVEKKKGRPAKGAETASAPKKEKRKIEVLDKTASLKGVRIELTAFSTVTYTGTVVAVAGENLLVSIRRRGSSKYDIHTLNKSDVLSITANKKSKSFAGLVGAEVDITLKAITRVLEVEKNCQGVTSKDGFITTTTADGGEYWVNESNAEYVITADDPSNEKVESKRGRKAPKAEVEDEPEDLEAEDDDEVEDESEDLEAEDDDDQESFEEEDDDDQESTDDDDDDSWED